MTSTAVPQSRTIRLPRPYPHQTQILLDPSRFKIIAAGRRWGKSTLGLIATVGGHGPNRALKGAYQGGKIWWVAPTHPIASEIWRDLKSATHDGYAHKDEVERRIEFPSGGSVTVRSAVDPESLVAIGLDGLVIDEAAKIKAVAWDFLRPTLADRQGWCVFISTPKGYNWFWEKFEYAAHAPGWARWQQPSSANPLMTPAEMKLAHDDAPHFFGQEYLARFEQIEGAEWPPEYFEHVMFQDWPTAPWFASAMALDPSKGKDRRPHKEGREPDYSAWVWGGVDNKGTVWIDADLDNVRDVTQIIRDGFAHYHRFRPHAVLVETNVFQELLASEMIRQAKERNLAALPVYGVENTEKKEVRLRTIGPYLAQRELRFRDTPGGRRLVQQLRDFPAGTHDDGPDALSMLLRMLLHLIAGPQAGPGQPKLLRA